MKYKNKFKNQEEYEQKVVEKLDKFEQLIK